MQDRFFNILIQNGVCVKGTVQKERCDGKDIAIYATYRKALAKLLETKRKKEQLRAYLNCSICFKLLRLTQSLALIIVFRLRS